MTKEWKTTRIGDLIVENSKSTLKVRDSISGGAYPFYTSGVSINSCDDFLCDGKNLFIATGGKACVQYYEGKAAYSTDCYSLTTRVDVTPKYLFYFLDSILADIEENMFEGAALRHLQKTKFREIAVPLPTPAEQQRIVGLLDKAFADLDTAKANLDKNFQNASALFESHLHSVFTKRGPGWVEKELGDVCDLFQGLCINAKTKHLLVEKSRFPLLRIKDLRNNSAEQYVADKGWPKNALVGESDIIYTRTGNSLGLVFRGRIGILHNNSFKVKPRPILNGDYLFWWLQNPSFRARITELASKAAQPDITHVLFKAQQILVPPLTYQNHAISTIENLREETHRLASLYERKLAAMEALKKSLLNQAFTGKL